MRLLTPARYPRERRNEDPEDIEMSTVYVTMMGSHIRPIACSFGYI
jgi:hypothetical protein